MLPKPLTSAGKATIAVAGFLWGTCHGFREPESVPSSPARARLNEIEERMARLEFLIARLPISSGPDGKPVGAESGSFVKSCVEKKEGEAMTEGSVGERVQAVPPRHVWQKSDEVVTHHELTEAVRLAESRIQRSLRDQMDTHLLAIGSLRTMIANTDSLLERVLARLEASLDETGT